jgi:hypothetical protein
VQHTRTYLFCSDLSAPLVIMKLTTESKPPLQARCWQPQNATTSHPYTSQITDAGLRMEQLSVLTRAVFPSKS